MDKLKKLYCGVNLTWKRLILFSIFIGIYTAVMAMIPILKDTSFSDLTVTFEVWIFFGIFIIINSKSAFDSALKCFIFFLISQPLVYLVQDVINGSNLFSLYYRNWVLWTFGCLPMGFVGYYMKKDKWWGLLILLPMMILVGFHLNRYLGMMIFSFPRHFFTTIFCVVTLFFYPLIIFNNIKIKKIGVIIGVLILFLSIGLTLYNPSKYDTVILVNGGSSEVTFDNSYKVYLSDKSFGTVDVRFDAGLNDWCVHAEFKKSGNTDVILESADGKRIIFDIYIGRNTYTIKKK